MVSTIPRMVNLNHHPKYPIPSLELVYSSSPNSNLSTYAQLQLAHFSASVTRTSRLISALAVGLSIKQTLWPNSMTRIFAAATQSLFTGLWLVMPAFTREYETFPNPVLFWMKSPQYYRYLGAISLSHRWLCIPKSSLRLLT